MRVIAGEFKGRILNSPKGVKIRPTSEKVKEALFNILGAKICGASFLELFAGSGSVGIEAKSRGAGCVYFVENNRLCIKAIEQNLNQLEINDAIVLPFDYQKALNTLSQKGEKFDLVFLDPPYHQEEPHPYRQGQDKPRKLSSAITSMCNFRSGIRYILSYTMKNCLRNSNLYDILKPRSWVIAEHHKKQSLPHLLGRLKLMFSKEYGDSGLSFFQKG